MSCAGVNCRVRSLAEVKFIALTIQLTMVTFLASSLAFHLLYIANKNFNPAFSSMRILSLGAFIAMRLEVSDLPVQ